MTSRLSVSNATQKCFINLKAIRILSLLAALLYSSTAYSALITFSDEQTTRGQDFDFSIVIEKLEANMGGILSVTTIGDFADGGGGLTSNSGESWALYVEDEFFARISGKTSEIYDVITTGSNAASFSYDFVFTAEQIASYFEDFVFNFTIDFNNNIHVKEGREAFDTLGNPGVIVKFDFLPQEVSTPNSLGLALLSGLLLVWRRKRQDS